MSKTYEFHKYCLLFPQADQNTIDDMASDIADHGLDDEDIILYQGKILDGRNRYLACKIAGVEPCYVEFDGNDDDAFQLVISKNFHRRHLSESQRGQLAYKAWEMAKNTALKTTLEQIAKRFKVGLTTVKEAGIVEKCASDSMRQAVQDGTVTLNKAVSAYKKAREETGINVKKDTPPEEKKKVQEAADRIMKDEAPPPLPTKPPETPGQEFQKRVLSGEFDGKRWLKNIRAMQANIAMLERMPDLYNDCFELLKSLDNQVQLTNLCSNYIDIVKKMKVRLQQNEEPDFSEVVKFFIDLTANRFPSIENDFGVGDKRELCEEVKDKFLGDCDKCLKAIEKIHKKLLDASNPDK